MWTATCLSDPVPSSSKSFLVHAKIPFASLLADAKAFQEGGRPARVALADFCARAIIEQFRTNALTLEKGLHRCTLEPLDFAGASRRSKAKAMNSQTPYVLERTDIFSTLEHVNVMLRARVTPESAAKNGNESTARQFVEIATAELLGSFLGPNHCATEAMGHIACVVAQNRLRESLAQMDAVAFIADGAILPRKSGANAAPMSSPPAVPCEAPTDSTLKQTLNVDMGALRPFLNRIDRSQSTMFSITGMVVPKGITLIAGGGYHGKVGTCLPWERDYGHAFFVSYKCVLVSFPKPR